ncbi:MAG: LytTR family DNA-binding domain-containing protein [Phenylobacterium sp.]
MGGLGAQLGDRKGWARDFALATALGLLLAPVGPFGSYGEPFGRRLVVCLVFSWTAALVWSPGLRLLLWVGARARVPEWLTRLVAVVALCAPIALLVGLLGRLHARLPAAVDGEILALQAEDHYVRVHTARGSALLLMRMGDAVAELDGLAGLQVHRSWWVARTAVAGAAPAGRRANLALTNGLAVPISRAAMAQARAAGFLGVRV